MPCPRSTGPPRRTAHSGRPGYEGAGIGILIPVIQPAAGGKELDTGTRTGNALQRSLRCLGERGFALLTGRWRTLQHITASPGKISDICTRHACPHPFRTRIHHMKFMEVTSVADQSSYRSRRMLTRSCPCLDEVFQLARRKDWLPLSEETDIRQREVRFRMGPSVNLHHIENRVIVMCWVFISGDIGNIVEGYARIIRNEIDVIPFAEIISMVDAQRDPLRYGGEIIRLAVAAPSFYDSDVYARISSALRHPDDRVREMALLATTFPGYAEFRPLLRTLAENDPVQRVRENAATVLDAFDQAGAGEP
jgi:hypothetical protein